MQGKEVDIQLLRNESESADVARNMLFSANERLSVVRHIFNGDHWGASPEAAALRDALLAIVDNRMREMEQLMAAAEKIAVGLSDTADLEEKTEQEIVDNLRKAPAR